MRFEVGGLHRDHTIIGGVRFVEAVTCKFFPVRVDGFGGFLCHAFFHRAYHKLVAVLFNVFFFLLGDRLTQFIRLGRGIPGEFHRGAHQLFLIHRNAEGVFEDRFHRGVTVFHFRFAVHTCDVIGDERHWSRAIQRHHRDNVVEVLRLHLDEPARHTAAFNLEDASRLSCTHQLE